MKKIFTTITCTFCLLFGAIAQPGSIDTGFNPGSGADKNVYDIALQQDGKIIIAGDFANYNSTNRNGIARLNADGSLDATFYPGKGVEEYQSVNTLAIQPDGKIIIGGYFTSYNEIPCNFIARLNADGSLDNSFKPGTGADNTIDIVYFLPDGKIIIGGVFTTFNGTTCNHIARLNADGSLDAGFKPGTGADVRVQAIALLPDKKIIIGGMFKSFNGNACGRIARLNADGSLDKTFNSSGVGADSEVSAIEILPDGKIIIGGSFKVYNSVSRICLARLNANGSLDAGFNPATNTKAISINDLIIQSDGKIVIQTSASSDASYFGITTVTRLNSDGSLDSNFNTGKGPDTDIYTLTLQPDGKILAGGMFSNFNNTAAKGIVRINAK